MKQLALVLLCVPLWSQSVPVKTIEISPTWESSALPEVISVSNDGRNLITCTQDGDKQGVIKKCTLSDGATLEEVMQIIIDLQSACYTREGVMVRPNRGESYADCMYNGATFRDWDKRATVLESSQRKCRKNKGQGEAPHFDPILRKTEMMSCSVLLK